MRSQRLLVQGVWYRYPGSKRYALRGASLEAGPGEILGVTGPNGSGKTTLLMVAAGLLEPEKGEAIVVDPGGRAVPARQARGIVAYHPAYPVRLGGTVLRNIMAGPLLRGASQGEALDRSLLVAKTLGLEGLLEKPMKNLSQGQAMLVSIARLVAARPLVLLLDEPASSLDTRKRVTLAGLLRTLATEGVTVVVVTHDTGFLRALEARVLEIVEGKIVVGAL